MTDKTKTTSEDEEVTRQIHQMGGSNPYTLTVIVMYDRKPLTMEVDTGISVSSMISKHTYKEEFPHL